MKLVVATHAMLLLVEVDDRWRVVRRQVLADGYHFGVSLVPGREGDFLAFHDTRFSDGPTVGFLRRFRPTGDGCETIEDRELDAYWRDVHQITPCGDRLLVTNTGGNSLVLCDGDFTPIDRHHFSGADHDLNHINSVYLYGGDALVLMHNRSKRMSEVAVCRVEGDRLREVAKRSIWHRCCHNLFIDGGVLTYNGSADSLIVRVDLATNRVLSAEDARCGHNKGLAVVGDAMLFGMSPHASRSERGGTSGSLLVASRQTGDAITTIDLAAADAETGCPELGRPTGNLNEVRCVDAPDDAIGDPDAAPIDWAKTKLAEADVFGHLARNAYLKASLPVRRFRKWLKS
ncbi:MAG: hypothetical protein AAF805_05730 [Planctomycetota bacterium]